MIQGRGMYIQHNLYTPNGTVLKSPKSHIMSGDEQSGYLLVNLATLSATPTGNPG